MTAVIQRLPVDALSAGLPGLDSVPEVLAWRQTPPALGRAVQGHVGLLSNAFQRMLVEPAGGELRDLVRTLPDELVLWMVCAPESCRRLLYGKQPSVEFFRRSALAERQRFGVNDAIPDDGLWTALGDCSWRPGSPFRAPILSNGAVVDLFSPHAVRLLRAYGHSACPVGSVDLGAVIGRLEDAVAVIGAISPDTARFFSSCVQVVIPWEDPSIRGRASLSDTRWVGAVACANVAAVDQLHLVDMLIHESVHSFLGMVEEHDPMISDLGAVRDVRVPSPWTGTPLHPRNFLHASYVWFALRQFWRMAPGRGIVDEDRAGDLSNLAGSGFESPMLWQALSRVAGYLSPRAQQTIPAFFEAVIAGEFD